MIHSHAGRPARPASLFEFLAILQLQTYFMQLVLIASQMIRCICFSNKFRSHRVFRQPPLLFEFWFLHLQLVNLYLSLMAGKQLLHPRLYCLNTSAPQNPPSFAIHHTIKQSRAFEFEITLTSCSKKLLLFELHLPLLDFSEYLC